MQKDFAALSSWFIEAAVAVVSKATAKADNSSSYEEHSIALFNSIDFGKAVHPAYKSLLKKKIAQAKNKNFDGFDFESKYYKLASMIPEGTNSAILDDIMNVINCLRDHIANIEFHKIMIKTVAKIPDNPVQRKRPRCR